MIINIPNTVRIIRSYPGKGTAETIFVDENETHWVNDACKSTDNIVDNLVPSRYGTLNNDGTITIKSC